MVKQIFITDGSSFDCYSAGLKENVSEVNLASVDQIVVHVSLWRCMNQANNRTAR